MFGEVKNLQQCYYTQNISHLVKKIKNFPMKAKSFRNTATYQKTRGSINRPPPLLYHGGGLTLRVRPRVNESDCSVTGTR